MSIKNSKLNFLDTVEKPSNSQIRKAGKIFRNKDSSEADLKVASEILGKWRVLHIHPMRTFQTTMNRRLQQLKIKDAIVARRLKRAPTIIDKLFREPTMALEKMQDIGGIRAIVKDIDQVRKLEKLYLEGKFDHILDYQADYISTPKASGYRGIHLIYKTKYSIDSTKQYSGFLVEMQIRTRLQHIWATAVETAGTFLGQELKSGKGDENWKNFFALTGSAFALIENSSVAQIHNHLSKDELFELVRLEYQKLKISETLKAFSRSTETIIQNAKASSYCVITLNTSEKKLSIANFSRDGQDDANRLLTELEKRAANGEPIQSVFVAVNDVKKLKKAYPNYFLETSAFLAVIERNIIK
jgi:hypothetical protein